MGDRAVISNRAKKIGVYLHWNGYREFVESVLAYCDLKGYRTPDSDPDYGWARLCQVIGNTLGGTLSLGVGRCEKMDVNNFDNGTYIIQGWNIKERLYQHYEDLKMEDSMFENLKYINEKQPKDEQVEEKDIKVYAENWEEKHIDRLNDERREYVEKKLQEQSLKEELEENKVKEQILAYETLETQGKIYDFEKGGGEDGR